MNQDNLNPDQMFNDVGGDADEDSMVMDLTDVSEEMPQREPVPAGIHDCIIENHEFAPSSSGNPMITFTFRITEPEYEGRFLFYHTVLNKESGLGRLKRLLARAVPDADLSTFNPKKFCEEGEALGLPLRVKVRVKPYQGRRVNDVTDVLAPSDQDDFLDS